MRKTISFLLELFMAVTVAVTWLRMVFHWDESGRLSSEGLSSLKYFTVLSNLLTGAASLCCVIAALILLKKKRGLPFWLLRLRLVSASAVALTFLTVLLFLGPLYGYKSMYQGANLWFHLLIPLLSLAGFLLLRGDAPFKIRDTLFCMLPVLLYGAGYLVNILINGRGEWPETNDWYGFLLWGLPVGICIFAVLIALTWGISLLLRLLFNRTRVKKEKREAHAV